MTFSVMKSTQVYQISQREKWSPVWLYIAYLPKRKIECLVNFRRKRVTTISSWSRNSVGPLIPFLDTWMLHVVGSLSTPKENIRKCKNYTMVATTPSPNNFANPNKKFLPPHPQQIFLLSHLQIYLPPHSQNFLATHCPTKQCWSPPSPRIANIQVWWPFYTFIKKWQKSIKVG